MFSADDLELFREVARRGSLTGAAQQLRVDQTTVGRHMNKLERSVGERLFDRKRDGWRLTDAGIRLLGYAETVHASVLLAREEYLDPTKALTGSVRVVTPEGFASYLLTPGLNPIRQRHPNLSVEVIAANRHAALRTREYDIAVSIERPTTPSVMVEKLADFELRVYAAPAYLGRARTIRSDSEVAAHPFVWYVEEALSSDTFHLLHSLFPDARALVHTNSLTGQIAAARQGLGLALLPTWIADSEPGLVRVDSVEASARRSYWMVTPSSLGRLARVQVTARLIRELAGSSTGLTTPSRGAADASQ